MNNKDDLLRKYANIEETQREIEKEDRLSTKWAYAKLIGGGIAVLIGVVMTIYTKVGFIYYGMVWVGVNFLIEGVLQYFKYEESDIPTADDNFIKIIVAIVSFGLAYFIIALIGGNYDGLFTEMMKNF